MPSAALYSCDGPQIASSVILEQSFELISHCSCRTLAKMNLFFWTYLKYRFFDKHKMLTRLKSEREEKIV